MVSGKGNWREYVQLWLVHSTKFVVSGGCALIVLCSPSWVPFFHMLAACVNGIIANVAKVVIKQPRPYPYAKEGYGMPSSHSQSVFYFFVALWREAIRLFEMDHTFVTTILPVLLLMSVYLIAASFVRVVAGYHTFNQVAVGCVLGVTLGFISFDIIHHDAVYAAIDRMGSPPLWVKLTLITTAAVGLFGRDVIKRFVKRQRSAEEKLQ